MLLSDFASLMPQGPWVPWPRFTQQEFLLSPANNWACLAGIKKEHSLKYMTATAGLLCCFCCSPRSCQPAGINWPQRVCKAELLHCITMTPLHIMRPACLCAGATPPVSLVIFVVIARLPAVCAAHLAGAVVGAAAVRRGHPRRLGSAPAAAAVAAARAAGVQRCAGRRAAAVGRAAASAVGLQEHLCTGAPINTEACMGSHMSALPGAACTPHATGLAAPGSRDCMRPPRTR